MMIASTSRPSNNPPGLTITSSAAHLPRHQVSQSPQSHLQRYRKGTSLLSLNSSTMSSQDVNSFREALLRHDASVSRANPAANHLQPVDRHALTARAHFRADPTADTLAQQLKWTAQGQVQGFPETEVLAAARESYHPIAPSTPQMQVTIKQIKKSDQPSSSGSPAPSPTQPVLLLNQRQNSANKQQQNKARLVSVENRPATSSSAVLQQSSSNTKPSSALSSASTPRAAPGSADLRKQYDLYQHGTPFLPQSTSTKYFYKREHGWLVKSVRDRRNHALSLGGGSAPGTPLTADQQSLNASLEVSKLSPNQQTSSPEPHLQQRSSTANTSTSSTRFIGSSQQQHQRLISATQLNSNKISSTTTIPYVTVVDLNSDHDQPEVGYDNALKISQANTGLISNALRNPAATKKPQTHHQNNAGVAPGTLIQVDPPNVQASNQSLLLSRTSQQQHQDMTVNSKQHPAALRAKKLRDLFSSYDDFKRAAEDYASNFPKLPQDLTSSPYLNEAKQRQIWCWLHYGENISDVDYLLSVC